jgi:hypothetical protein
VAFIKMKRLFENKIRKIEAFKLCKAFIKITRVFEDISRKIEAFV